MKLNIFSCLILTAPTQEEDLKLLHIFRRYFYWAFLEIVFFFAYLISISLHILCHQISPYKAYMYYLNSNLNVKSSVNQKMWGDKKLNE